MRFCRSSIFSSRIFWLLFNVFRDSASSELLLCRGLRIGALLAGTKRFLCVRRNVSIFPTLLISTGPLDSNSKSDPTRSTIALVQWILPGIPVLSILEARFTASPQILRRGEEKYFTKDMRRANELEEEAMIITNSCKMKRTDCTHSYKNLFFPTTPATTGPTLMPMRRLRFLPGCSML